MELGQEVKFKKHLKEKEYCNYYGQEDYSRYKTVKTKEKVGIIVGKRTIWEKGYTKFHADSLSFKPIESKTIYLIACDLKRFFKVPKEWLESKTTRRCNKCGLPLTMFASDGDDCAAKNCNGKLKKKIKRSS